MEHIVYAHGLGQFEAICVTRYLLGDDKGTYFPVVQLLRRSPGFDVRVGKVDPVPHVVG